MNYLSITILVFFLPFIFFDGYVVLGGRILTGHWKPISNVTDATVVDIGKFAVDEHDLKDHTSLKFVKVVSGEIQVVAGMNYKLTIKTVNGGLENNYVAVVWVKPIQKSRQLVSFKGPI
ncbi:hypothetical protein Lser_V15G04175 [Lactuca serriola]